MVLSKEDLGKLVKEARKIKASKIGKKYTQVMLANDIQKSQGYIGDIESGRTYPTFRVLCRIAEACEVPFSFFGSSELDSLMRIVSREFSDINEDEVKLFSNFILSKIKSISSYPFIDIDKDIDLQTLKDMYTDFKNQEVLVDYICDDNIETDKSIIAEDTATYISDRSSDVLDVENALLSVLNEPEAHLHGKLLSHISKTILTNALKIAFQSVEQLQNEEDINEDK